VEKLKIESGSPYNTKFGPSKKADSLKVRTKASIKKDLKTLPFVPCDVLRE
jgi:hypothetical protein